MSDSKIQIKIGNIEFSGEGDSDWLSSQLDKILDKVPELLKITPLAQAEVSNNSIEKETNPKSSTNIAKPTNLAMFLKEKNATSNQVKKFLATSAFLQLNGKNRLNTSDITKALKDSNQTKLGNPSEYLNQNVKKGHCEKDGSKEFFVTSHGFEDLGVITE
jgi:hypothetical protein